MTTLNIITVSFLTIIISVMLYRYIISRQRLDYDNKINIKLIFIGFAINILMIFLIDYFYYLVIYFGHDTGFYQLYIQVIKSIITIGLIYLALKYWVIKPEHYINRYDIVIYALCIGIGFGLSNALIVTILIGSFRTIIMSFSLFMIPLGYAMVMAYFMVKAIEKKDKYAKWMGLIIPTMILLGYSLLNQNEIWFGFIGNIIYESIIYIIFTTLLLRSVRKNRHFKHIDVTKKLTYFSNRKTIQEIISYRFDIIMSYGNIAVTMVLIVVGLIGVVIVAVIILVEAPEITNGSLSETLWLSFMRVLDPGNVATDPEYKNMTFLIVTTIATFFGLALISTYIGLVSGNFSQRIEKLREGNTKVLEKNHLIILGFSEMTLSIIKNIQKNKGKKDKITIVVLSNKNRKEMEDKILEAGILTIYSNVICRTGELTSSVSLLNVGITHASKIIIVGDEEGSNFKVGMMVKSLLDSDDYNKIDIMMVTKDENEINLTKSLFSERMKIYSNQESNYDAVLKACSLKTYLKIYAILYGSKGDYTFSLIQIKECYGKTFGEIIAAFTYSSVIGLIENNEILLNPNKDIIIDDHHKLIFIQSTNVAPDYNGKILKSNKNTFEKIDKNDHVIDIISNILIIGQSNQDAFIKSVENKYPSIRQTIINQLDSDHIFDEIDKYFSTSQLDMIVFLGDRNMSDSINDAICINILAYLDSKYSRSENNYVIAARLTQPKDIKFAYEINGLDMVIENDLSKNIALDILDNNYMLSKVKQKVIQSEEKIKVISASKIINNNNNNKVSNIYHQCALNNLVLIGYIKENITGEEVVINPNKNDHIQFNKNDLLIVID